jgi:DNA ligase-associated metallophosphoesterase
MQQSTLYILQEQHLWLNPNRYIFWEEEKAIILSDLHFGKTGHFRKHGIAVPQTIFKEEIQRLIDAVAFNNAQKIIAVGDLFHSHANKEMDLFLKWRNDFPSLEFHLVKGNHDILKDEWYEAANIILHKMLHVLPFSFIHDLNDITHLSNPDYYFSGHIHPGIQIKGISKQSLRFPCFFFGEDQAILPAFSRFTGLASLKTKKMDVVFAIVNETIIKI